MELKPNGWELSAMYGRLLKAVEYDELQPAFLPTYKRMGYGVKAGKVGEKYQIHINMLNAKDITNSLVNLPDSLGITPMENQAGSISFLFKPFSFIKVSGEYGVNLLTTDRRSQDIEQEGILGAWQGSNNS